jgi:hypothetical protein
VSRREALSFIYVRTICIVNVVSQHTRASNNAPKPAFISNTPLETKMDQDHERGKAATTASSSEPVFTLVVTPPERGSTPAPLPCIFDEESRYNDRLAPGPPPRPRRTRVVLQPRRRNEFRGLLCVRICFAVVLAAGITFALGMVVYCDLEDLMCGREVVIVKWHHMQD